MFENLMSVEVLCAYFSLCNLEALLYQIVTEYAGMLCL